MSGMTVNEMIKESLTMIGEWQPNEIPRQYYFNVGKVWLNFILNRLSSSGITVPFNTVFQFQMQSGKKDYTVGIGSLFDIQQNFIVDITTGNIDIGGIKVPIEPIGYAQYYGSYRQDNAIGTPKYMLLQSQHDLSTLTFYPAPDQAYVGEIVAKCVMSAVQQNSTLMEQPSWWQEYLIMELAYMMSMKFPTAIFSGERKSHLDMLRALIVSTCNSDLSIQPSTLMQSRCGLYDDNNLMSIG